MIQSSRNEPVRRRTARGCRRSVSLRSRECRRRLRGPSPAISPWGSVDSRFGDTLAPESVSLVAMTCSPSSDIEFLVEDKLAAVGARSSGDRLDWCDANLTDVYRGLQAQLTEEIV